MYLLFPQGYQAMNSNRIERIQSRLDRITHKWWFFLIVIVLQFLIPSYAAKNFTPAEIGNIVPAVLTQAFINQWEPVYPLFKVLPIVLIISIPMLTNRISLIFVFYV